MKFLACWNFEENEFDAKNWFGYLHRYSFYGLSVLFYSLYITSLAVRVITISLGGHCLMRRS